MSDNSVEQQSLMLGDRINWPFILGTSVLNFFNSVVKMEGEQSEQEVREAAIAMYNSIPTQWTKVDMEYKADLKAAIHYRPKDIRRDWLGKKMGKAKCPNLAKASCEKCENLENCDMKDEYIDPYKLFHACVNVFQRRGLLSKTIFTEKIVPEPSDFEEAEEIKEEETEEE